MAELTRLAETKSSSKTTIPKFSLILACLFPLKNSFIHHLSFASKREKPAGTWNTASDKGIYKFDHSPPEANAVFLSHGHLDHSAYLSFIKREIPVYCGETTQTILRTLSDIRHADLEFNVADISFNVFRTGDKVKVDDLVVEPIHVDHSIPGAYGFLIHTSNGTIVYTGDFRDHGAKPQMTHEFVEKAHEAEPVAVVTEATNMTGATVSNEGKWRRN